MQRGDGVSNVDSSTLLFSNTPDFSTIIDTVTINSHNTGANAITSITFDAITARYVRWIATPAGSSWGGGAEMAFMTDQTQQSQETSQTTEDVLNFIDTLTWIDTVECGGSWDQSDSGTIALYQDNIDDLQMLLLGLDPEPEIGDIILPQQLQAEEFLQKAHELLFREELS